MFRSLWESPSQVDSCQGLGLSSTAIAPPSPPPPSCPLYSVLSAHFQAWTNSQLSNPSSGKASIYIMQVCLLLSSQRSWTGKGVSKARMSYYLTVLCVVFLLEKKKNFHLLSCF